MAGPHNQDLAHTPAAQAPEGQTTNFVDPPSQETAMIAISTVMILLTLLFVSVRLFTSLRITRLSGTEDWLCVVAVALFRLHWRDPSFLCRATHVGCPGDLVYRELLEGIDPDPPPHTYGRNWPLMNLAGQIRFAGNTLQALAYFTSRMPVLLLYIRLFGTANPKLKIACYVGMMAASGTYVTSIPLISYFCTPSPGGDWNSLDVFDKCKKLLDWAMIQGSLDVVLNVYIYILPLPILFKLQMPPKRKLGVLAIFLTGLLAVVSSAVGLYYRYQLSFTPDVNWNEGAFICMSIDDCIIILNFQPLGPVPDLGCLRRICVAVLAWRLWTFTVVPTFWPHEPKVLPYWVPFLGHTWAFLRNPERLINDGFHYFGSNQPFSLAVAGRRTVIIRDVQDVSAVWRNTQGFVIDPFVVQTLGVFGMSKPTLAKLFADPRDLIKPNSEAASKSRLINENPKWKGYMDLERDWFTTQLLAPEELHKLLEKYRLYLGDVMQWEKLSPTYMVPSRLTVSEHSSKAVFLGQFCRYNVSYATIKTFFGPKLEEVAPEFLQNYQDFEKQSWKIFYRLPPWLAKSANRAKNIAIDGLVKYMSLAEGKPPADLEWIFRTITSELGYLDVSDRDIAGFLMIFVWAFNNNAHKIAFWIFALHDQPYLSAVRDEIDRAFCAKGENPDGRAGPDMDVLLSTCPHLDAIWYETMRLYNATSAIRDAKLPCTLGGKNIRVGDQLVAPFRQFHLNRDIFGTDASVFRPGRFLQNKGLHRAKGYAPFGGGYTYCPGRLFAQREIYLFVAEVFWNFDLELVPRNGGPRMPQIDLGTPSPAAMSPDDDVQVRLKPRSH
ncbi:Cytochrome P450 [Rhypophila sp. PSN 637]